MEKIPKRIKFVTFHDDPIITDVYACSDIHGDIEALLIELEHCAKVISSDKPDHSEMLKKYLEDDNFMNIMNNKDYRHDLGYTWCGRNKYIVIVGDMMDRNRSSAEERMCAEEVIVDKKIVKKCCGEYPYEELKILLFLNALHEQALEQNGKIIKLAGNHEIMALLSSGMGPAITHEFNSEYALSLKYYDYEGKECDKLKFFERGMPGSRIMYGESFGIVVKIHDYIFIHAGILSDNIQNIGLDNLEKINADFDRFFFGTEYIPSDFFGKKGFLTSRLYDQNNDYASILCEKQQQKYIDYSNIECNKCIWQQRENGELCKMLESAFKKLCTKSSNIDDCEKSLKLVVGHCPQILSNDLSYGLEKTKIPTYGAIVYSDEEIEIVKAPIKYDYINIPKGLIYGITVDCLKNNIVSNDNDLPALYRIDIGVSKGFDQKKMQYIAYEICDELVNCVRTNKTKLPNDYIGKLYYICDTLLQRLPQMLHINFLIIGNKIGYDTGVIRASFKTSIEKMTRKYLSHNRMGTKLNFVSLLLFDFYNQYYNKVHIEEELTKIMYNYTISEETFAKLKMSLAKHETTEEDAMHKYMKYKAKYLAAKKKSKLL